MLVKIFGDKFDFATPNYQVKTSWIHFENQDGDTIHRHSTGVELEFLFNSHEYCGGRPMFCIS